jgi:hypothetical protein
MGIPGMTRGFAASKATACAARSFALTLGNAILGLCDGHCWQQPINWSDGQQNCGNEHDILLYFLL